MSFFVDGRDLSNDLDRYITGNYGEDSIDHEEEGDEININELIDEEESFIVMERIEKLIYGW